MVNHGNRLLHHAAFIESIIRHGIDQRQVADVSGYQVLACEIMLEVLSVRFVRDVEEGFLIHALLLQEGNKCRQKL